MYEILINNLGVHSICKAFPKVRIITSMVDPGLKANTCFIEPGIGNYGGTLIWYFLLFNIYLMLFTFIDRYFGTEE